MTSNRRGLSDLPLTSPHRDAWPSPTMANASVSAVSTELQNSVEHFYDSHRSEQNVFYAECSRQVFNSTVYGQVGKVVLKVIESTQCRRRGTITTVNVAYSLLSLLNRQPTGHTPLVLTKLYSTTRCRQLRPVCR